MRSRFLLALACVVIPCGSCTRVELVNKAVFANPNNAEARALQADALEQLGYQTESATWRNAYLMGALELRSGPKEMGASSSGPDTVRGMTNELLFDFIALRLRSMSRLLNFRCSRPASKSSTCWSRICAEGKLDCLVERVSARPSSSWS